MILLLVDLGVVSLFLGAANSYHIELDALHKMWYNHYLYDIAVVSLCPADYYFFSIEFKELR